MFHHKEYRETGPPQLRKAQKTAMKYNAEIKEVNTDRGTQFYSTKKNPSTFEVYVKSQGMKFIRKA